MATSLLTLKRVSSSDNVPFEVKLNDSDKVEILVDEVKVLAEQQSNIANLTDSTSGTTDGTLDDVSTAVTGVDGTGSNAASKADVDSRLGAINSNFAELNAQVDAIITALEAHGLTADS